MNNTARITEQLEPLAAACSALENLDNNAAALKCAPARADELIKTLGRFGLFDSAMLPGAAHNGRAVIQLTCPAAVARRVLNAAYDDERRALFRFAAADLYSRLFRGLENSPEKWINAAVNRNCTVTPAGDFSCYFDWSVGGARVSVTVAYDTGFFQVYFSDEWNSHREILAVDSSELTLLYKIARAFNLTEKL